MLSSHLLLFIVVIITSRTIPFGVDAFAPIVDVSRRRQQLPRRPVSPSSGLFYATEEHGHHETPLKQDNNKFHVRREEQRREWVDRSVEYYSKVMREERRKKIGQIKEEEYNSDEYHHDFTTLAKKHYFALRKIKDGKPRQAERIYRRIIDELMDEDEHECDHAKLAVTTLLLALLLQRQGKAKDTRTVFLSFFRIVVRSHQEHQQEHGDHQPFECACSAKVVQAYALFEMKQGFRRKSVHLVNKAIQLDPTLKPVLNWKQFRDASNFAR